MNKQFKFIPQVGMRTLDCFLHGIGTLEVISCPGTIEYVGPDYFILRPHYGEEPMFIKASEYSGIEPDDFTHE